jgi:hypothetical protein
MIRRNERININKHQSRRENTEQTLPGGLSARPGGLSARSSQPADSPLSLNLSKYSNNLEIILDVYDIEYLGYNTWFFKRTSYKNDHVNQFDSNDQENPMFSQTRHTIL